MNKRRPNDKRQRKAELQIDVPRQDIEAAAYFKAEPRGFAPGFELANWLEAERDLDEASPLIH